MASSANLKTVANFDETTAAVARSEDLRVSKSRLWHIVDATRNLVLPLFGVAWVLHDIWIGNARIFDVCLFFISLSAIGIGMTVGLHRYFSHQSFSAKPPLKSLLAVLGSMAWQRPLFLWVARHRLHHNHTDVAGDYHSPHVMFDGTEIKTPWKRALHAHYAWLHVAEPNRDVERQITAELRTDPFLVWCDSNYNLLCVVTIALPALAGLAWYGSIAGAIKAVMWGGLAPIAALHQLTWLVNSACHLTGSPGYKTGDTSTNVGLLGWLAFGEGYHNNHHAFPYSPRMGFDQGQFDIGWLFIRACERLGLAYDLKPTPSFQQRVKRAVSP